jgi:hypothetical protein
VPDRHPDRIFDQGQHGDADSGITANHFSRSSFFSFAALTRTGRGDLHRERAMMKAPAVFVSVALALAILLAASFLIATGTRGENALRPLTDNLLGQFLQTTPARK